MSDFYNPKHVSHAFLVYKDTFVVGVASTMYKAERLANDHYAYTENVRRMIVATVPDAPAILRVPNSRAYAIETRVVDSPKYFDARIEYTAKG